MATNIKTLKDVNGDIILPRTRADAITMADGLSNAETEINNKAEKPSILEEAVVLGLSDLVSIETATGLMKMTVANLKELLGINAKVPSSKVVTFATTKQVTTVTYGGQYYYDLITAPYLDDTNNYVIAINNNYELALVIGSAFYTGIARIFFDVPIIDKSIVFRVSGIRIS